MWGQGVGQLGLCLPPGSALRCPQPHRCLPARAMRQGNTEPASPMGLGGHSRVATLPPRNLRSQTIVGPGPPGGTVPPHPSALQPTHSSQHLGEENPW